MGSNWCSKPIHNEKDNFELLSSSEESIDEFTNAYSYTKIIPRFLLNKKILKKEKNSRNIMELSQSMKKKSVSFIEVNEDELYQSKPIY